MSGGVDSAVAAARAVDAGHDVTGVHLALSRNPQSLRTGARGCCTLEDARDARRAADVIGIPFYVWDLAERFARTSSTTSSPSTRPVARRTRACGATRRSSSRPCSTRPLALGFDAVVHRPLRAGRRRCDGAELHRAVDAGKDQSYVLGVLDRAPARARDVPARRLAKDAGARTRPHERGLAVADKPDSHDICFIADGDTARLPRSAGSVPQPGPSSTPTAPCSASTRAPSRSPSGSAGAADRPPGSRRPAALRARHLAGDAAP